MKSLIQKKKYVIPILLVVSMFLIVSASTNINLAVRPDVALPSDAKNSDIDLGQRPDVALPSDFNDLIQMNLNLAEVY